jgi:peptide/nickel transport system ATP-binding protein/oligopeptide transport system ATP-binding protein
MTMAALNGSLPLLSVADLSVRYGGRGTSPVHAVNGVTFTISKGETLGLIGESGSGKSTVARAVVGLQPATAGSIRLKGVEVWNQDAASQRAARSSVQIVFQNANEALDPRASIAVSVSEPLARRLLRRSSQAAEPARRALELVGLQPSLHERLPRELSGGQRQRASIARALVTSPELIICDEIVSALDVSVQAEIINLLIDLKQAQGISYLFISHDLGVVSNIADRIAVMYLGRLAEIGRSETVISRPAHPYTRALLASQPQAISRRHRTGEKPAVLSGAIPSPASPPSGCYFRTRCPMAVELCAEQPPEFREIHPGHWAACHFAEAVLS